MQRLIQSCVEGNTERLTSLIDSAVNPRELVNKREKQQGFTALHIAVMMGAAGCTRKVRMYGFPFALYICKCFT